jgi:hypothetical protein
MMSKKQETSQEMQPLKGSIPFPCDENSTMAFIDAIILNLAKEIADNPPKKGSREYRKLAKYKDHCNRNRGEHQACQIIWDACFADD